MSYTEGDKVRCINLDQHEGTEHWAQQARCVIGDIYTVKYSVSDTEWIQLMDAPYKDYILPQENFELVVEEVPKNTEKEDNPNIKMITTFVPTWAKWMAMDVRGYWVVLSHKPISHASRGKWVKSPTCRGIHQAIQVGKCDPRDIEVSWQETLHEI